MTMEVNVIGTGINDNIEMQIDPTWQAARVSIRPLEFNTGGRLGGHYAMSASIALAAGQPNSASSPLFAMRWMDSNLNFVLLRFTISAAIKTAFGASQLIDFDLIRATSFATNPTGGTPIVPSSISQKMRTTQMSNTLLSSGGAIMISSGSPLSLNQCTLDTQPFGYAIAAVQYGTGPANTGVNPPPAMVLYEQKDAGQHPMVLGPNEGLVLRNGDAYGATGVVKLGLTMVWAETPSY
jgi:hypothetical protein